MGLYRRGKIYWFTVMQDGKRMQVSTKTRNRKLAEVIYAKVMTDMHEGRWFEHAEAKRHTFDEMMKRYLREHSAVHKATVSYQSDKNYVKHLSRMFSGLSLFKVTPSLIAQYKAMRLEEGASASTVSKEMICLSHAFNLAVREWEWCTFNPCQRVKLPRVRNQIDRWMTYEEQDRLLEACYDRPWLRDVIIFAVNTGMRQGEIINLRWKDVDLFRKTATVMKTKNGDKRTVPLNRTVTELLKAKSKVVSLRGYVFTQRDEQVTKREVQRQFATALKRAKVIDFRFHDLRHTFATRLAQSGVDIYAIAKLLGHKDIRMTQRYAHHSPESVRYGVDILDKMNSRRFATILLQ
jgi:integrase